MNKKYIDSLFVTAMVFAIIGLFSLIPFKTGILDPIGRAISDFDIYDLVFSRLRPEQKADTSIVLVNIGNLDRGSIARQIDTLNKYSPKVVAMDIFFWTEKNAQSDSALSRALTKCQKLVMVSMLSKFNDEKDTYDTLITSTGKFRAKALTGFANFPEDEKGGYRTIRSFQPFALYKGTKIPAFPLKIVETADKKSYQSFLRRNNQKEIINYRGNFNKFYFLDANSLLEGNLKPWILRNKIVLMGFMGENMDTKILEDIFFTPLNERYAGRSFPDMYGVVINANIVSMLLNENFIDTMPYFLSLLLAITFCFLCALGLFTIKSHYKDWFGLAFKWFMLLLAILELDLGVNIFNYFNYKINLTLLLAAIVLTPTCMDLYQSYIEKRLFKRT
ncbi:MAG: CHASE2 domain-containing protein [Ignavibacteria bacterium]|nr:CHASE2 domain-containing protein [Ignavibacteria bacterium]MCU7502143.1 CHASE2 domain-containing protein [Ignavibacteria bacterium]MCU7515545.1 CHASE2 domain-containing protein [Ignavibacteria bacterium]